MGAGVGRSYHGVVTRPQTRLIAHIVFAAVMLFIVATVPRYGIVLASAATLLVVVISLSKGERFAESLQEFRHRAATPRMSGGPARSSFLFRAAQR